MSDSVSSYDITNDHEFDVLAHIHQHEQVKQRDIAGAIGLSLGMTNAVLKRLANKGFITMRRINSRNIHYLVTPSGVDVIAKRSYRYLRRTVGHIVRYKETMRATFREAAADPPEGRGATEVLLIGESDLDFLVEWCAEKEGLDFRRVQGPAKGETPAALPAAILEAVEEARAASGDDAAGGLAAEKALLVVGEQLPLAPRGTRGPWWDIHLAELVVGGRGGA